MWLFELVRANGDNIVTVPPHSTQLMQPLDVGWMKPFKTFYNAAICSLMMTNPGQLFGIYHMAPCVSFSKGLAIMPQSIINAFKKIGVFPVDRQIFTEDMFAPNLVSEKPEPTDILNFSGAPPIQGINKPSQPPESTELPLTSQVRHQ